MLFISSRLVKEIISLGGNIGLKLAGEAAEQPVAGLERVAALGPPIDLVIYTADALRITHHRRFGPDDPDLRAIHIQWEQALRKAVQELPAVRFEEVGD